MDGFASRILMQKYAHTKPDGTKENWDEIAYRVVKHVMKSVDVRMTDGLAKNLLRIIKERKFIPGGRYLYASGRPIHQTQNCLLLKAEDSREGWSDLMYKCAMSLMTGAGIGVVYSDVRAEGKPIRKIGGFATGPCGLMQMVNECGRGIMQGGSRRSAIWAGLHWNHADCHKFIRLKNWSEEVKAGKAKDYNAAAPLDGTNISVILDDEFFAAYDSDKHPGHTQAHSIYWAVVRQMLETGEPGFSIDVGDNAGEHLRNAPVSANTYILTDKGYVKVGDIVNEKITLWTGKQWVNTIFKKTGDNVNVVKVTMTGNRSIICDPTHEFITDNNEKIQAQYLLEDTSLLISLPENLPNSNEDRLLTDYYTLGYCYGDGSFTSRRNAEITFCTDESKKCVEGLSHSLISSINYKDKRGYTRVYLKANDFWKNRYKEIFPEELYSKSIQSKAHFLAGLFDSDGNYFESQNRVRLASKHYSFLEGCRRLLESLGILSGISTAGISTYGQSQGYLLTINTQYVTRFTKLIPTIRIKPKLYEAYRDTKIRVLSVEEAGIEDVFCCDVGVEEHSFMAEGIIISNCTELTSKDDSDICNIGSINMSQISSLEEMQEVVDLSTAFLVAGTVYSDVPYALVDKVRTKNRRIGLGLLGLHEWLLKNGKTYGPDDELTKYMDIYKGNKPIAAGYAKKWDLSSPVKTRAIAPTGTIGIIAESTTGIEPIFCVAFKRRYLKGNVVNYEYVVDPCAKRLIESGKIDPDKIEDAYTISPERRVAFQAWLQQYVDHGISSTINLPAWGSEANNENKVQEFGRMLLKYLPNLRGITAYPDGARNGQPLSPVKYSTAMKNIDSVFVEGADICDITKSGSCGS